MRRHSEHLSKGLLVQPSNGRGEIVWNLSRLNMMASVPTQEFSRLESAKIVARLRRRDELTVDLAGPSLYLITTGVAKLCRDDASGKRTVDHLLRAGDVVGILAAIPPEPRPHVIEAIDDTGETTVLELGRRDLVSLVHGYPRLCEAVMMQIETRQQRLARRTDRLLLRDVAHRVIVEILDIARENRHDCEHGLEVDVRISQQDLAQLAGTSRQAVNRVLRSLERRHYLHRNDKVLCIADLAALEQLARSI